MIASRTLRLLCTIVSGCLFPIEFQGQPSADLARLQAAFPGYAAVTESVSRDVVIKIPGNGGPEFTITDSRTIFILTDNSTAFAQTSEYFNTSMEKVRLQAYSLVPENNSYRKYPVTQFTKTRELSDDTYSDDNYLYSYNFPAVGKGARLVSQSASSIRDQYYPLFFSFGRSTPVEIAKYSVTAPSDVKLIYHLFGSDTALIRFTKTTKGKLTTYSWEASGLESYSTDEYSPSQRFFVPHIFVNIAGYTYKGQYIPVLGTQQDLYGFLYGKIKEVSRDPSPIAVHLADSLTAGEQDADSKVSRLYSWVQENIRYVAIEDGDQGFVPHQADLVLDHRYGDCKGISNLLITMLRSIGLNASFTWVGTREIPYAYTAFPGINNANHMIVTWWKDENTPVLLDGTSRNPVVGEISSSIQGKQCLIGKDSLHFLVYDIPVSSPDENTTIDTIRANFENNIIQGRGTVTYTGDDKRAPQGRFEDADADEYRLIMARVLPMASNKFTYRDVKISDIKNTADPFSVSFTFTLPDYTTTNNGSLYLNLNFERFLNDLIIKPDRKIPIEFRTPFTYRMVSILETGGQFTVSQLPSPDSCIFPGFQYVQRYELQGDKVILTTEIIIDSYYVQGEELEKLREMTGKLDKAYARSILLKKTEKK
jgi:transglutaminase-like putative cysteine protease